MNRIKIVLCYTVSFLALTGRAEATIVTVDAKADEIAATQFLGPDQLLGINALVSPLSISASPGSLDLDLPVTSAGYQFQSWANLNQGTWKDQLTFDPVLIGGKWRFVIAVGNGNKFFRLQPTP